MHLCLTIHLLRRAPAIKKHFFLACKLHIGLMLSFLIMPKALPVCLWNKLLAAENRYLNLVVVCTLFHRQCSIHLQARPVKTDWSNSGHTSLGYLRVNATFSKCRKYFSTSFSTNGKRQMFIVMSNEPDWAKSKLSSLTLMSRCLNSRWFSAPFKHNNSLSLSSSFSQIESSFSRIASVISTGGNLPFQTRKGSIINLTVCFKRFSKLLRSMSNAVATSNSWSFMRWWNASTDGISMKYSATDVMVTINQQTNKQTWMAASRMQNTNEWSWNPPQMTTAFSKGPLTTSQHLTGESKI